MGFRGYFRLLPDARTDVTVRRRHGKGFLWFRFLLGKDKQVWFLVPTHQTKFGTISIFFFFDKVSLCSLYSAFSFLMGEFKNNIKNITIVYLIIKK